MKRIITISALLVVLSAGLVAAQPFGGVGPCGGGAWATGAEEAPELQTLEGRLQLEQESRPVLLVDGEQYTLMIPPVIAQELSVRDGQTITVEGYVASVAGRDLLGDDQYVRVQAVEAGGTRVVMPEGFGPMSGARAGRPGPQMGRRGGMHRFGPGGGAPAQRSPNGDRGW
jgi:hypothetical protein